MKATACTVLALALFSGCVTSDRDAETRRFEQKLDSIVIPEMDFREANPRDAVKFFEAASREFDKDGGGVSIVSAFSDDKAQLVTMVLRNVTLRETLNICCEIAGLTWTIEGHRVKIRERPVGPTSWPTPCITNPVTALRNAAVEKKLDTIILPEVTFRECQPTCGWRRLRYDARQLDASGQGVNMVFIDTSKGSSANLITFSAYNISLREALDRYCAAGRLTWSTEDSAIKLRPDGK